MAVHAQVQCRPVAPLAPRISFSAPPAATLQHQHDGQCGLSGEAWLPRLAAGPSARRWPSFRAESIAAAILPIRSSSSSAPPLSAFAAGVSAAALAALGRSQPRRRAGHQLCRLHVLTCSAVAPPRSDSSSTRSSSSTEGSSAASAVADTSPAPDKAANKEAQEGDKEDKSLEERFADFTRVLPWFDFAATCLEQHIERRARAREERSAAAGLEVRSQALNCIKAQGLSSALVSAMADEAGAAPLPEVVEAVLTMADEQPEEAAHGRLADVIEDIQGRWEVVWSGALTPLQRWGLPRQCLWVEVAGKGKDRPAVLTLHSGLPLLLFGSYFWISVAGELLEGDPLPAAGNDARPVVIRLNRYWTDIGREPRADIGRVDGGFINNRVSAFGAALVTPVLLEFGALKWVLERFGLSRVFEVEVPAPGGAEDEKVKLEASLELYFTLLAMVAFPETLSTCPVPYLDTAAGVCIYEIPMLGPIADLPDWLHPGGNAAALLARRLGRDEEPSLMRA